MFCLLASDFPGIDLAKFRTTQSGSSRRQEFCLLASNFPGITESQNQNFGHWGSHCTAQSQIASFLSYCKRTPDNQKEVNVFSLAFASQRRLIWRRKCLQVAKTTRHGAQHSRRGFQKKDSPYYEQGDGAEVCLTTRNHGFLCDAMYTQIWIKKRIVA